MAFHSSTRASQMRVMAMFQQQSPYQQAVSSAPKAPAIHYIELERPMCGWDEGDQANWQFQSHNGFQA
jgi:hypothetical protein